MKLLSRSATRRSVLSLLLLAGLSACGGGGDGNSAGNSGQDPNSVPVSAVASVPTLVSYLNKTPTNETRESLNTDSVTLPTTDSDEPTDV